MLKNYIDSIDLDQALVHPITKPKPASYLETFYLPITCTTRPNLASINQQIVIAETHRRLARLACRLEEYYLIHHQYPEQLEELAPLPPHLNQEVLSLRPIHYRRDGNGYHLYSLDANGLDPEVEGAKPTGSLYPKWYWT